MPTVEEKQAHPAASLDMAELLTNAYELGDMINSSAEVADYLYWKEVVAGHAEVQELIVSFEKAKTFFEECQRFGRYHPDFHAAKEKVKALESKLEEFECVIKFKIAEQAVDRLLYDVSHIIAAAVSDTIKVPGNEPVSGCGSGGSCGCGSGGCG